jgi:hypothetical protein
VFRVKQNVGNIGHVFEKESADVTVCDLSSSSSSSSSLLLILLLLLKKISSFLSYEAECFMSFAFILLQPLVIVIYTYYSSIGHISVIFKE